MWTGIAGRAGLCAGKELVRPVEQPVFASPRGLPATGQAYFFYSMTVAFSESHPIGLFIIITEPMAVTKTDASLLTFFSTMKQAFVVLVKKCQQ